MIVLGLFCIVAEFYAAVKDGKTSMHRTAHLVVGLILMGLMYLVWFG